MSIHCPRCAAGKAALNQTEEILGDGVRLQVVRCMVCGWRAERTVARTEDGTMPTTAKKVAACAGCGKEKKISSRGLCGACWMRHKREGTLARFPETRKPAYRATVEPIESESDPMPLAGKITSPFADDLAAVLAEVGEMLWAKNAAYGDSALAPVRIFSRADPVEQIRVRIDDKISRLMRGSDAGEDTEMDLLGYLVLLRVARRRQGGA
jgi:rubredoxin